MSKENMAQIDVDMIAGEIVACMQQPECSTDPTGR